MFREQFLPTPSELIGIRNFIVKIYVKAWFSIHNSSKLNFLKSFIEYSVNRAISKGTREKFASHLWYLNKELIGWSFFDKNVLISEKQKIVKSFKESTVDIDSQCTQDAYKRGRVDLKCHNWMQI